ncbi:LacI family DNA-binding transcriptional regulator [Neomicrococcus lactis]|uniref:DNA-binding LacI/PurR family transcriptional regulator n=1 Tax=Neomicrococcus lactis TaxID=732241 RepID=A0A7W8YBN2_9MICC|nr:LacI family DNA-binding transcriptional regulator [Neomicrococcus lactis]MBB5598441.1 DNA-binding LacI/PurR family transcriptional regulator [Neomicrococcus lactis]
MSSIRDVASRAGVSVATVSRALTGRGKVSAATKATVQAAARELGYVASVTASSLASGRTRNIGIVMPTVGRWYYSSVLQAVASELNGAGYDLTLYITENDEQFRHKIFADFLLRKRLDAVISVTLRPTDHELRQLKKVGRPLLAVGGIIPGVATVRVDEVSIAELATEHLLSLGHRDIAFIGSPEVVDADFQLTSSRERGYLRAMEAAGITPPAEWRISADFTTAVAYQRARNILVNPRFKPTAFFCASDEMAFGAIMAARDLGLSVPQDISVIGIDGHEIGELFGLTTIAQFPAAQGSAAALKTLALLGEIELESDPTESFLSTEFVARFSTAPPPA